MAVSPTPDSARKLRVALVGAGLMATSHTVAYRALPSLFPGLGAEPELSILADASAELAQRGAQRLGFARWTDDWREAVTDPDIDVVDIVTPNWMHHEIALAAIAAGKHVYCEKPLAVTEAHAAEMARAAKERGVATIVGFSYLGNPGVQFAKQLIEDGTLGEIWSISGRFVVDANADPSTPRTWHYERAKAGLGALGDIGSHVISILRYLGGDLSAVFADFRTMVKERPEAQGALSYGSKAEEGAALLPVENEDAAFVLGRFRSGASATIEASRVANGHAFDLAFEVTGSKGSLRFEQQESYKVDLFLRGEGAHPGTTTVNLGPSHPNYGAFWPFPGVTLGLHELKAVEIRNFFAAILEGTAAYPAFEDGWRVTQVLDAAARSVGEGRWVDVAGD